METEEIIKFIKEHTMLGTCGSQIVTIYELKELLLKFQAELIKLQQAQ